MAFSRLTSRGPLVSIILGHVLGSLRPSERGYMVGGPKENIMKRFLIPFLFVGALTLLPNSALAGGHSRYGFSIGFGGGGYNNFGFASFNYNSGGFYGGRGYYGGRGDYGGGGYYAGGGYLWRRGQQHGPVLLPRLPPPLFVIAPRLR